jgi:hypothetical protein
MKSWGRTAAHSQPGHRITTPTEPDRRRCWSGTGRGGEHMACTDKMGPPACLIRGLYGKLGDLCSLRIGDQPGQVMDRHDNVAAKSWKATEILVMGGFLAYDLCPLITLLVYSVLYE